MNAYEKIANKIDSVKDELINLSLSLYSNPELKFKEYFACETLCKILKKYGYEVKQNIAGLETAFIGECKGKSDGPTVALLAEYDALPIGHACGHNLIATISIGAAIAMSEVIKEQCGRILVIGTPAEEGGAGKVIMCENNVFKDVDFAMMVHPGKDNLVQRGGLATNRVNIEYFGVQAHSARPEEGINALSAIIQTFNLLDSQRGLLPYKANINGIITNGGKAANVIPDYASCEISIRASTVKDLNIVYKTIEKTVEAVNCLFGTKSKISRDKMRTERYPNKIMDDRFKAHLESLGEKVDYPSPSLKVGSSDVGNVSLEIPIIQPYIKISDFGTHTVEFKADAASDYANIQMVKAAKALAMTAYDIFESEELRNKIKEEFREKVPVYPKSELGYK